MKGIVLHPHSAAVLDSFVAAPSHAALLVGPNGIGKTFAAQHIAASVLGTQIAKLDSYAYYLLVQPTGTSISIETIRELQKFLQLKTVGHGQGIRRVVIVEHADLLTIEAQNAFLKILEEPPADTMLLLTATNRQALLPTILSRVQLLSLSVPHEADVKAFFADYADAAKLTQSFFLSGGLPGLLHALVSDDASHPLTEGVAAAKQLLQKQLFERLAMVEQLSKQKETALYTLEALLLIAHVSMQQATTKADHAKLKQWHAIRKAVYAAQEALRINANTKLTLTNLMLSL